MASQSITYIGVDLSFGKRPFTFAALDENRRILALGEGEMIDALSYLAGLSRAVVAVNGPLRPNGGWMADPAARALLEPQPPKGRWVDMRVAEYELAREGLEVPYTSARPAHVPAWMQTSLRFGARLCEELRYQPYPRQEEALTCMLEVQADAAFWSVLGVIPFPAPSLEGRIQRQLALADLGIPVPDAMDFFEEITRYRILHSQLPLQDIHSAAELNALMAAFIAMQSDCEPGLLRCFGRADEALIYLPQRPIN